MKEARIIMPIVGGEPCNVHSFLQADILEAFGGYTAYQGSGGWTDTGSELVEDLSMIYDIACDEHRDSTYDQLFEIAMKAGRALNQQAVYIRYPDGYVEIASCTEQQTEPRLGVKRLPKIGEVWRTHCDAKVAVTDRATVLDGGFKVTVVAQGSSALKPGSEYVVNLDGRFIAMSDPHQHPLDLVAFIAAF